MRPGVWIALAVWVLTLVLAPAAFAQEGPPTDDQVNAIAKQLYCPVCENVPLDVCPTQACQQWRDTIREKLTAGWTEDQITQYFVDQYGARVLATPPVTGLNWLVYLLPPLAFAGGAYLLVRALRAWRTPGGSKVAEAGPAPTEDRYVEQLERELRERT